MSPQYEGGALPLCYVGEGVAPAGRRAVARVLRDFSRVSPVSWLELHRGDAQHAIAAVSRPQDHIAAAGLAVTVVSVVVVRLMAWFSVARLPRTGTGAL